MTSVSESGVEADLKQVILPEACKAYSLSSGLGVACEAVLSTFDVG